MHHKISIAITLIAFAFMSSIDIYFLITKDHDIQVPNKIIFVILYTYFSIVYPFSNSIFKELMNDYLSPIILTFWIGIFHSIILIIFLNIVEITTIISIINNEFF